MSVVRFDELPPGHVHRSLFSRSVYILLGVLLCEFVCLVLAWVATWIQMDLSSELVTISALIGVPMLFFLFLAFLLAGAPALLVLAGSDVTRSVPFTFFWTVAACFASLSYSFGALYVAYFGGLVAMVLARCFYPLPTLYVEPWSDVP